MTHDNLTEKLNLLNISILDAFHLSTEKKITEEFIKTGLKILEADFGYCFLKSPGRNKFELIYITPGVDYEPIGKPRKNGIVAKAFRTKQPQLISNVTKANFIRFDAKSAMESVAVVPITYKNNTYGTLHFAYSSKHEFTKEDKNLYAYLGNSAAQAITINRLYNNLRDFKNTLDNTLDSIFIFDPETLKMEYANDGAVKLTGKKRVELLRSNISTAIDGLSEKEMHERMQEVLEKDLQFLVFESFVFMKDTKLKVPVEISLQHIVQKGQPERFLVIVRDITERKESEETIRKMAYYDALTSLPNRSLFNERLIEEFDRAMRSKGMFSVFFIDLDRFKVINDIYGHQVGDELLRAVANRMQKSLPPKATLCRMGGDEFMVLLPKLKGPEEAVDIVRTIQEKFVDYFQMIDQEIYVNCSIGIATYPMDGKDIRTVLKHADLALHRAKEQGGNSYQQYNSALPVFYSMQPKLESQLRQAIKKNELVMHYQPVVNAKNKKIVYSEALVRWNHPEMGLLYPDSFINQAEESGLIVEMGEWVLNEVANQISKWKKAGKKTLPVSVNVSPRQLLRPTFIKQIEKAFETYGVNNNDITLELTETFLMRNIDLSIGILEQLKLLGLHILIDDFGTGYASLNYLKRLPIDGVKIDRSFIMGSTDNIQDAGLTAAIISIAHQLNLEVIAEGVETETQLKLLREHRCEYAQGNFFYKPMEGEKLGKLLEKVKKNEPAKL